MIKTEKETEKIEVDAREILFFQQNAPSSFVALILENLSANGIVSNRHQIRKEVSTIKKEYSKPVIEEARRLLKAIKGLEYTQENEL